MLAILAAHPLVHVNAALNTVATVLLVVALVLIKQGRERAHQRAMQAALAVSAAFLGCYLYYHYQVGSVKFTHGGAARVVYLSILASHVVLAMSVPFLAIAAAWFGTRALDLPDDDPQRAASFRRRHRAIVRWAYPIWVYVSVTGVIVYLMLYHLYPPEAA